MTLINAKSASPASDDFEAKLAFSAALRNHICFQSRS